ncbi:trypsin-like serine protease [Candidatus Dojkabacteria bacterium]|nr:trypsin-like serine protease [Candidatus Dojkabacteria bacterium]
MIKKIIPAVIMLVLLALGAYLVYVLQKDEDVAPDDSSALYGGVSEFGYPSAGYVITETSTGIKTCGYSVIDGTKAVTAAHCVDDATGMYLGKGIYTSTRSDDQQVTKAIQKEGWVREESRTDDFALLRFSNDGFFTSFADIKEPAVGCNYRVIAYGRTELPEDPPMLRKSAQLCISDINSKTFRLRGTGDSGICFGDSGSPIYEEGTNNLVGLVVSIVSEDDAKTNPCGFNNTAIAVRVDANMTLIDNEDTAVQNASDIVVAKEFSIVVANETIAEKLGVNNLTEKDILKIGLGGTVAGMIVVGAIALRDIIHGIRSDRRIRQKAGII